MNINLTKLIFNLIILKINFIKLKTNLSKLKMKIASCNVCLPVYLKHGKDVRSKLSNGIIVMAKTNLYKTKNPLKF